MSAALAGLFALAATTVLFPACGGDEAPKTAIKLPDSGGGDDVGDATAPGDTGKIDNDTGAPVDDINGPGDALEDTGIPDDAADAGGEDVADVQTPDGGGPDTAGDTGTGECAKDPDCDSLFPDMTACQHASCINGSCVLDTTDAPGCCVKAADCDDGNTCTVDSCPAPGGTCSYESDPLCCEDSSVYLDGNFDNGSLQGFTTKSSDDVPSVGWVLDTKRSASGSYSAYFGETKCHTYYAGALDASCMALDPTQTDGQDVGGSLLTPDITLPANGVYFMTFKIWSETEGATDPTSPEYDPAFEDAVHSLQVYAVEGTTKVKVWSAVGLNKKYTEAGNEEYYLKSTDGAFALIAADLSFLGGSTFKLEFEFGTNQELPFISYFTREKFPEGIYLDDIQVKSGCAKTSCTKNGDCKSADPCGSNECTLFVNTDGTGACLNLPKPDCEACPSGNDSECDDGNSCTTDTCKSNVCQHATVAACCTPVALVNQTFELAGLPAGWTTESTGPLDWHASQKNPSGGSYSLWFGDEATGTYDGGGQAVKGSVTTKTVALPGDAVTAVALFDLYLSTEWNVGEPPKYTPGGPNYDILFIEVLDAATGAVEGGEPVWTSYDIGGSTADGGGPVYKTIVVDLEAWLGKSIKLRFTFDSGDASNNGYPGAHIDDLQVKTLCDATVCTADDECSDDNPCTPDSCVSGVCVYGPPADACCSKPADCDDGNPCTTDTCEENVCSSVDNGDSDCCFDKTSTIDDFEGTGANWAFQGGGGGVGWTFLKNVDEAFAGEGVLYFGNPNTMTYESADPSSSGVAISAEIMLPSGGTPVLSFQLDLSTEFDNDPFDDTFPIDRLALSVLEDDQATEVWSSDSVQGSTHGEYVEIMISLKAFAGKTVRLQFGFDSGDNTKNDHKGALVDDLVLDVTCQEGIECFNDGDCPDASACDIGACVDSKCTTKQSTAPECCQPTESFSATFDEGASGSLDGFTVEAFTCDSGEDIPCNADAAAAVQWRVSGKQYHSKKFSLYFGDATSTSFDDPGKKIVGTATSGAVMLAADKAFSLDMWVWIDVEQYTPAFPDADRFDIFVVDGDGETLVWDKSKLTEDGGTYGQWVHLTVPLTDWAGKEIGVKLSFDSNDGYENGGQGIYVDDLSILELCD